jgi:hypothetical protein
MKKAKEYAEEFVMAQKTMGALAVVVEQMISETSELVKKRQVTTNVGHLSIFNEVDDKFRSFAKIVKVSPDGFAVGIQALFPDVYKYWTLCYPHRRVLSIPAPDQAKSAPSSTPTQHLSR